MHTRHEDGVYNSVSKSYACKAFVQHKLPTGLKKSPAFEPFLADEAKIF